jgi:hypothetical protein
MPKLKETVDRVHSARQSVMSVFKDKWTKMQQNSDFVRLDQYSAAQLSKMVKQNRVPYVLDYINSSINILQGIQRDKRTEIYYLPVEPGDSLRVEILNLTKDSQLRRNDFMYVESDVFKDGIIEKVGAVGYEWSLEKNKNGALKIFRIPPRQLLWDLNAREYNKADGMWCERDRLITKDELSTLYPDHKKQIMKMSFDFDSLQDAGFSTDYIQEVYDPKNGWLYLMEHYYKTYKKKFFIRNLTNGLIDEVYYDTQKDVDEEIRERLQEYEQTINEALARAQSMTLPPPPPQFDTIKDTYPVITKACVAGELGLEEEELAEPFFPIDIYHPYFHDGDWWCPVDVQKDAQRYFNKMFSMIDHWIGTQSKGLLTGRTGADPNEKARVKSAWASTGGFVEVENPNDYQVKESKGPAPQLYSQLELARQNLEDNSGGRNFMGKKETASESGIAVQTRIEQGGLSGFVLFDNLRRWKQSVGEKVAWYLTTYMTVPQIARIEGEELVQETLAKLQNTEAQGWFEKDPIRPGVGYLSVNTGEHNTLEQLKVDVVVDEARWSANRSSSILNQLNAAMQSNPGLANTFPPEEMVDLLQLPYSTKEKIKERMKQMEAQQQALEQAKVLPPPSISASLGDIMKLPPQAASEMLFKAFGVKMDPREIQNPDIVKAEIDIAKTKADLQMKGQSHEQDLIMKSQTHSQQMQQGQQKMAFDHVKGLQTLALKEEASDAAAKNKNGDGR